jgi:4-hydroxybenzoate polyprenyltransferase
MYRHRHFHSASRTALLGILASRLLSYETSAAAFSIAPPLQKSSVVSYNDPPKCNIINPMTPHQFKPIFANVPENQSQTTESNSPNQRYLPQLFLMMRPINFPIVTLFHVLGVHLSLQLWQTANEATQPILQSLLRHPSMMMVLLSLLLVTSTSMITNDYYDARNGVDVSSSTERDVTHYHPLAQGLLPFNITKTFDSYLYAILLLSSAFVPGVLPRLMVLSGAIVTYLYTVHLKPRTFIKNWSCAALVAMSPITSGLAAWEVLSTMNGGNGLSLQMMRNSPLMYLVMSLFAGITSREILMDITDLESDARANIRTIPVKYGAGMAANVAMGWSFVSGAAACALPLVSGIPFLTDFVRGCTAFDLWKQFVNAPLSSCQHLGMVLMMPSVRRLVLSISGSTMLLYRAYSVWKTRGENVDLAERAVGSSLFSVLLVLASFV